MRREEREQILKQGVVSAETPRDRRDREALAEDIRSSGLKGRRLRLRLRNFRPRPTGISRRSAARCRTWSGSARSPSRRQSTSAGSGGAGGAARRGPRRRRIRGCVDGRRSRRWSFDEVNDLIDAHNRFYPAESRLPMDPRTRNYALVGGEDYRRRPLDAAWALEQFPAAAAADALIRSRWAATARARDRRERDRAEERAEEVRARHRRAGRRARRRASARPARRPPRRCS